MSQKTDKKRISGEVVSSACREVEVLLKDKTDDYRRGFEAGARWRLALSESIEKNGR